MRSRMHGYALTAQTKQLNRIARIALTISLVTTVLASLPSFGDSAVSSSQVQSATCGARVANYNYRVPFEGSPWNTPICDVVPYNNDINQGKDYGSRLYEYGQAWNAGGDYWTADKIPAQKGKFMTQFGLNGDANDYSTPIYHITPELKAKGTVKRFKICNADSCLPSNLDQITCWDRSNITCMAPDTPIPWDSTWRPSGSTDSNYADDANDREMIIVDDTTGQMYGVWMYDDLGLSCFLGRDIWYALSGKSPETRQCVAGASTTYDASGKPANYYTYNQGVASERGMGIQNAAMIVTPEEVQAGEIRHALTMEAFNTMGGTVCTPAQLAANDPNVLGKTCGYAVAPATRVEFSDATDVSRVTNGGTAGSCTDMADKIADPVSGKTFRQLITIDKQVPEGMRFKLTWDENQIETWLNTKAKTDPTYALGTAKRNTAKIFAIALKDYGWIVGDTTCAGAGFTTAGAANLDAKTKWASLGIKDNTSQMLLEGLFTPNNIIAVDPPVTKCVNGTTTKLYCPWLSSNYQSSQFTTRQTPVTTPPTITVPPTVTTGTTPPTQTVTTKAPITTPPSEPVTTKLPPNTTVTTMKPPVTTPPITTPPITTPPITTPPITTPPVTTPPITTPQITTPPVTTPPITAPPKTTPPVTTPPTQPVTTKLPPSAPIPQVPTTQKPSPATSPVTSPVTSKTPIVLSAPNPTTPYVSNDPATPRENELVTNQPDSASNNNVTTQEPKTSELVKVAGENVNRAASVTSENTLPFTGTSSRPLLIVALVSMLVGLGAIALSKRRTLLPITIKRNSRHS